MKFNNLVAFEKHLQTADPDHLASIYLIVDPQEYSQKKIALKLALEKQHIQFVHASDLTRLKLDEHMNTFSMFSDQSCLCLVGVDLLPKALLSYLKQTLKQPSAHRRIILTASKMMRDFNEVIKLGVALDLSLEKPWARDKRLSSSVMNQFNKEKIRAPIIFCDQIVKLCGSQEALIDQEIEKLLVYLHGKREVCRSDLKMVTESSEQSIFKIGQAIVERNLKEALNIYQAQKFPLMMLIYALRSLFQRSYRLKGLALDLVAEELPQIKGYMLEKSMQTAQQLTHLQFKKILFVLFEVELMMKSLSVNEEFLASLMLIKVGGVLK